MFSAVPIAVPTLKIREDDLKEKQERQRDEKKKLPLPGNIFCTSFMVSDPTLNQSTDSKMHRLTCRNFPT